CGGGRGDDKDYDLGLHIMALFVVLVQSAFACAFPLIAKRFPALRIPPVVLFLARHFGTGVLIATAFVHLLPTAFISLLDPCLPAFWTEKYPAMPGAIAMAAVFFVTTIEMVFTRGQMKEVMAAAGSEEEKKKFGDKIKGVGKDMGIKLKTLKTGKHQTSSDNMIGEDGQANVRPISSDSASTTESVYEGHGGSRVSVASGASDNIGVIVLTHAQKLKRAKLQVMLLEMGILFHSVFIGMALSVTSGSSFIVLLIAILFHQTFEGLALGSRIAVIPWESSQEDNGSKILKYQPWLMACAYGLTTPIGQAIGLGLQKVYDPASETGLVLVGTMNAVSSGLLLYAGLVELLAEDFLSDESWVELRGRRRVVAAFCVLGGAAGMALIGAWA
ncbi:Zinc/iron permease, partial [Ascobolus immersus RN42]